MKNLTTLKSQFIQSLPWSPPRAKIYTNGQYRLIPYKCKSLIQWNALRIMMLQIIKYNHLYKGNLKSRKPYTGAPPRSVGGPGWAIQLSSDDGATVLVSTAVMSRVLALLLPRLSLFAEFCSRKYFWAWLVTWTGCFGNDCIYWDASPVTSTKPS